MNPVHIGVAGWSYPDWNGIVYSRHERDTLRFVAGLFGVIEIDSAFYRIPTPEQTDAWQRRTADLADFRFTSKLCRLFTHEPRFDTDDARAFRAAMEPLLARNRLSHLLAQFPWHFGDGDDGRRTLTALSRAFGGMTTLAVELRHVSWQQEPALDFLRSLGVTLVNLDYPLARQSFSLPVTGIGEHAYVRLHGRNASAWFDPKAGRDRTYDYLYTPAELDGIAARIRRVGEGASSVTVVANNHYRGQAAANALEIEHRLTGRRVETPPGLLAAYPRLATIAEARFTREGELDL